MNKSKRIKIMQIFKQSNAFYLTVFTYITANGASIERIKDDGYLTSAKKLETEL